MFLFACDLFSMNMNGVVDDSLAPVVATPPSVSGHKPWEHVWSIGEMRNSAPNWQLASDVGVRIQIEL